MSSEHLSPKPGTETGRTFWLVAAAALAVVGLFRFFYFYIGDVRMGGRATFAERAINESTGAATAFLVVIGLVWLWQRFPIERGRLRTLVPVYAVGLVALGVVHTTLMWGTRVILYPALNEGTYGYGPMPWPYVMELPNQIIMFAATLGVLTAVRHSRLLRDRERRATALERDLARAQLHAMRLQLQPHFLFNALNTVSATMYDDPRAADEMLEQLGALLRHSLRRDQMDEVALEDELAMLEGYVAIMRARFGQSVRVRVEAAPATHGAAVPSLLLQPLVENAVRHGNASRLGVAAIDLRIRADGDALLIDVEDDGPGAPDDRDVLQSGLGLSLTAERLRLLYGSAHALRAGNRPEGGFGVHVRIPLRTAIRRPADDLVRPADAPPARR
ncbi:MAG TPA: histidine kinase [Gemmatimonadaceae bacterium]|nr:histidine kinase [Gemmatimonadaceae bacterium]